MIGTIVNSAAIIVGSILGIILKKGIPENIKETVMHGLGLCVLMIGILNIMKVNNVLLVICSIVIGGIIGEIIDIDAGLKKFGDWVQSKFSKKGNNKGDNKESNIAEGFVTASLLFCVGAMAVVGSLESGLSGEYKTLFAKSILDGITSIIFASSLGIGVTLSAVSVFLYQGAITLLAKALSSVLIPSIIADMTAVGGLLIVGLSLNMLEIKKIKVANLLIAIFIPIFYEIIIKIF